MKGVVALLFVLIACTWASSFYTVYYDPATKTYTVKEGKDVQNGVAWAEYGQEISTTGWARFLLETSGVYEDSIQAYGAGYLEGFVTADIIYSSWYNSIMNSYNGKFPDDVNDWFSANNAWVEGQIVKSENRADAYWNQIDLVQHQVYGMHDGYNAAMINDKSKKSLSMAFCILIQLGIWKLSQQLLENLINQNYQLPNK
jgi:hypothetical protein